MTAEVHKYDGGIINMDEAGLIGDFYDPEMHQFAVVTRSRGMGFLVFPDKSVRELIKLDNNRFKWLTERTGVQFRKGYIKQILGGSSILGT